MNVRFLDVAARETEKAALWYEDQNPGLGDDFNDEVCEAWKAIEETPDRFPIVDLPRSKREIRCFLLDRFPYAVYYEIKTGEAIILAVAHTSRRPLYWKRRK